MSYQKQKFGMMDEAYFVPKSEILSWINDLLKLSVSKIQVLGSGSIYCQILDVIHPGKVSLNKVNWKAKNDYEFIANLRIFQNALDKVGIKHYIDVQKIARAKYQDNLELIQWFKRFFDLNCGTKAEDYDAQQRRGGVLPDFSFADKNVTPKSYNASGQVINANKLILPTRKIQQGTVTVNRAKSPATQKQKQKVPINRIKSVQKKPQTSHITTVIPKKTEQKHPHPPIGRTQTSQHKISEASQKKLLSQLQSLKKSSNQVKQQLQIIRQIALSKDSAQIKLKLIQQVLHIKHLEQKLKQKQSIIKPSEQSILNNKPSSIVEQQSALLQSNKEPFLEQGNEMNHQTHAEDIQFQTGTQNNGQNIQGSLYNTQNEPQFFQQSNKPSMISEDDCI